MEAGFFSCKQKGAHPRRIGDAIIARGYISIRVNTEDPIWRVGSFMPAHRRCNGSVRKVLRHYFLIHIIPIRDDLIGAHKINLMAALIDPSRDRITVNIESNFLEISVLTTSVVHVQCDRITIQFVTKEID
jgi:hypothetical protein